MLNYNSFPFTGLDGSIERKEDGTKTEPRFHPNYLSHKPDNDQDKAIRYIRCGLNMAQNSDQLDIFILDTDAEHWTTIVEAASGGSHLCKVDSDKAGRAHFYFKWNEKLPAGKMVLGLDKKLELFNGSSGVYGVSEANKTKKISYLAEEVCEPSDSIIKLLLSLINPETNTKAPTTTVTSERRFFDLLDLGEFAKMMEDPKMLQPKFKTFLKLVTPKRYYDSVEKDYDGVIHPDKIPDGEGNNYLRDIRYALLLAKDVSPQLTQDTLALIGCYLWSQPISLADIKQQISSDKTPDHYEEGAEKHTTAVMTKYGRQAYIFKVRREGEYWIIELPHEDDDILDAPPVQKIALRNWQLDCKKWLAQETYIDPHYAKGKGEDLKEQRKKLAYRQESIIKAQHKELVIVSDRTKPGGINADHTVFNEYPSSEFLGWINEYIPLESNGDYPTFTINFLKNLAPVKEEFDYLLRFMKTFLTTNWKTAVILYFLGAGGTGKSSLIKYLTYLVGGTEQMLSPSLKEYLADKNGEVFTKTLIVHEEYSKQGTKADFAKVDGIDKQFTGSETVTVRRLYKESYNVKANGIILKTDNLNSVNASLDNRRIFTLNPKKKLTDYDWHSGDPFVQLKREAQDFSKYLMERVDILEPSEFNEIPFESNHTKALQMEEHEDDMLMQMLLAMVYKDAETLVKLVKTHSAIYKLVISGRGDRGITISTLVKFVRMVEPQFAITNLNTYTSKVKEVLVIKDASLGSEVEGMPSKRDKRIILSESFLNDIKEVTEG